MPTTPPQTSGSVGAAPRLPAQRRGLQASRTSTFGGCTRQRPLRAAGRLVRLRGQQNARPSLRPGARLPIFSALGLGGGRKGKISPLGLPSPPAAPHHATPPHSLRSRAVVQSTTAMAQWIPITTTSTICGTIGLTVFQRTRYGSIFRTRRYSARVPTHEAIRRMACFSEISRLWTYRLTDDQRQSWIVYARSHPLTIPCRGTLWLSGQQFFSRINVPRCIASSPLHYWPQSGD